MIWKLLPKDPRLKKYFSDCKIWPQMGHFLTTPVLRALTGEAFKRLNLQPDTYPAVELYKKIQKLVKISFQLWEPADQTPLCHICTPTVSGPCSPGYLFYSSFFLYLWYLYFCICTLALLGICFTLVKQTKKTKKNKENNKHRQRLQ